MNENLNGLKQNNDKSINTHRLKNFIESSYKKDGYKFGDEFIYDNLIIKTDLIINNFYDIELVLISDATKIRRSFIHILAFQHYVLSSIGINIDKFYIWYLDKSYVKNGEINIDELSIKQDVSEDVLFNFKKTKKYIANLQKELKNKSKAKIDIGNFCYKFEECDLLSSCMSHIPKTSIFNISGLKRDDKYSLYYQNIISFEDVQEHSILKEQQKRQVESTINQTKIINKEEINNFLNNIKYPIYYIDFEAYQEPIPRFDNTRVYEQTPFSYSIHIEYEDGKIIHKEFISDIHENPKIALSKAILNDIKDEGTYIAYNAYFEKYALKKIAYYNTELEEMLESINDRFQDLFHIFKNQYYYLPSMNGSRSIKSVISAMFPNNDKNYDKLDLVSSGYDAMNSYLKLRNLSDEKEKEKLVNALKKYCEMDTLSMLRIIRELRICVVVSENP